MPTPPTHRVRLALPHEAAGITAVQRAVWATTGLDVSILPDEATARDAWAAALTAPPLATYRVLVALPADGEEIVGVAVTGPSDDEDAEATTGLIGEFLVHPAHRRQGHGTRLLQACVDTLTADGFERATWWVTTTDDAARALATSTGWEADGAHRELGTDEADAPTVRQVRLHCSIG